MRLLHAGALEVCARVVAEPAASDGLKEHVLTAMHSLAGAADEGLAVPDLLGRFLGARLPGTQRSALAALQIIREKAGRAIDARLAGCEAIVGGLRAAAGSSDAQVASEASALLAALPK